MKIIEYINGKLVDKINNYIVLECNLIGYKIYVSNLENFELEGKYKIYIYEMRKENEFNLYGFNNIKERSLFLKLISVKGVGCKMASNLMIAENSFKIIEAINLGDINYLKTFPKIGDKIARQIILDLKGKLVENNFDNKNSNLIEVLKNLGYKNDEINSVLNKVKSDKLEDQIKEALKLLLK